MNWQGINEFVEVIETESFTQAASKLSCSTAHISRQVSKLETRLKVKLFNRSTRKTVATHEGIVFYQHCRGVLDRLLLAEEAMSKLKSKPHGKIKLTAPVTYGSTHILPVINDFIELYPEIEVDANLTNRQVDLLDEGYDLAIRIGSLKDSSLVAHKISQRTSHICGSPSYFERHGTPKSPLDLKEYNCLLGTIDSWRFKIRGNEKRINLNGNIRYNNGYGLADAAVKGLGIVQLPIQYTQNHIDKGELVTVLDDFMLPDDPIWALFHHNQQLSPKIRMLVDFLTESLG